MTGSVGIRRRVLPGAGFGATAQFLTQYTKVHQMMMVARVATWNLQWQVKGFVRAMPSVDPRTLLGRFVDGSDVEGIDLKASVANMPWDELDQQTCQLLLINTVALYEAWCYEICGTFQRFGVITEERQRQFQRSLQYPDFCGARPRAGIASTISGLKSADGISAVMTALMSSVLPSPVDTATFSPRMRLYRMFKEARNSIAHSGSMASADLCDAYNGCAGLSSADLGMQIVPDFPSPVLGKPVSLSWRGIIGLSDMLRRLVADVDHLLMCTETAERDLIERLRNDPGALQDPLQANAVVKSRYWAKLPNGPWIVIRAYLENGQNAVYSAVVRLLNITRSSRDDFMVLWPELLAAEVVEIRQNLRDI